MMKNKKTDHSDLLKLFNEAMDKLQDGKQLEGADGALTPLIKRMLEKSLEGEMDDHVSEKRPNRRNGKGSKQVKTSFGEVGIQTPRDRDGTFDPQILPKRQRQLGPSLESKIISLYSMGMSYRDIAGHIDEMYGMELSPAQLTAITDKVWPEIEQWQSRPLDRTYVFVWLDALFYKVRQDGQIKQMAAYMVLGMRVSGQKELLGIYLSETESASFWLQVLSDLQTRGVEDIIIASIDNLKGFKEAISTLYPQADIQLCIVHQIRNSIRYVNWKDSRQVVKDMKLIYKADNVKQAEKALEDFELKWGAKYPAMILSWKRNWEQLSTFYAYPQKVRSVMYTTNSIEGFHRQVRKATKSKGALPSPRSLQKLLYLVCQQVSKKWSQPRSWTEVLGILTIMYPDRITFDKQNDTL